MPTASVMRDSPASSMLRTNGHTQVSILDIRRRGFDLDLVEAIRKSLNPGKGQERSMPTLLLYDEQGLKLFEDITYLDEYYLTNAEIEVLENHAADVAQFIEAGSLIVELGSGNLRKVDILLQAFEKAGKDIEYYALDLSKPELERTLTAVGGVYKHVRCHGLFGTYDDGLAWLKKPENIVKSKCVLWLGSSIGNLNRAEAAKFLGNFSSILGPEDAMLIGIDACQDADKVYHGYNDREGKTHQFVLNGLSHANRLLDQEVFKKEDWEVIGEYDADAGRHHAFYSPIRDTTVEGSLIRAGERVRIEESYKYSAAQSTALWQAAGLTPEAKFSDKTGEYSLHLVSVPNLACPSQASEYATQPVPSVQEFEQLWLAWDVTTKYMIPVEEHLSKPINLRNCCLFYLGHIPNFLDIHLARATGNPPTEPGSYRQIFERGIDPDVENPEHCHAHSEIPNEWPPAQEILAYQERVRDRARSLYDTPELSKNRKIGRALWIGFEHEVMHLETLLYMLLQSEKTVPPPGVKPNFEVMATQAQLSSVPNQWIEVPTTTITIGTNDPENDDGSDRYFGWDNEKPIRHAEVPAFEAKARPITNEDYARFLEQTHREKIPASWTCNKDGSSLRKANGAHVNGNVAYMNGDSPSLTEAFLSCKFVKTVYGPIPLSHALDWPVFASYNELNACAKWMDGRIPTADEIRAIYSYADGQKTAEADSILTRKISAVNGHLSNEGVEISPPSNPLRKGAASGAKQDHLNPDQLFADLEGCNVGFKNMHPTSVTQHGNKLSGRGETGGVWEWSSSVLERWEGFKPMDLYPGYTNDFFDGKHNIVLGGSWATHPRVAGRKSFVNWYQRNYPYAWCGARLVRDIK